jgi:hypothetical protein
MNANGPSTLFLLLFGAVFGALALWWLIEYVGQIWCYSLNSWNFSVSCPTYERWCWSRKCLVEMTNKERVQFGMPMRILLCSGIGLFSFFRAYQKWPR